MLASKKAPSLGRLLHIGLLNPWLPISVVLSAGVTVLLAKTGVDAAVNQLARLQDPTFSIAWSAFPMLAGFAAPVLMPLVCAMRGHKETAKATLAAFLVALIAVSVLKALTSRVHPEALVPVSVLAKSQTFSFGFFQSGLMSVVEGWPSGHVATNAAGAIVLARRTNHALIAHSCWIWLAWVALATTFGISGDVHWLSDSLAGLLIAFAVALPLARAETLQR
ncbi:phosphatase PAP2 family protein [Roseibium sp. MMSF_3412]|uniref:phosphatase PAP2 family protein n=1 Tax=Roseibium sp. MMSF_3412 TaxID=3046712 RepID=UPI00273E42B3|nr:phosphatase PAP2 family protein [Roseibium sp. MMSF_3412]